MMIFTDEPATWSDLQNKVAQIFEEIGCLVEVEKDVTTVRGIVNIDVYVQDITKAPNLIYLCECKYWEKPVPKSVVHSFRTVVSDYGAHIGLLISKQGFQSGAFEASANSNIMLLTWQQFQELFFDAWYAGTWKKIHTDCSPVLQYLGMFNERVDRIIDSKDNIAQTQYWSLFQKFCAFVNITHYPKNLTEKPDLPITIIDPRPNLHGKISINSYREYFEILLSSYDYAIKTFELFIEKHSPKGEIKFRFYR